MRKNKLLSASFEQSKKIVSKKILTKDGANIGLMSSMKFLEKILALFISFCFNIVIYAVGVGFPMLITLDEKTPISISTLKHIKLLGNLTHDITLFFIILFCILVFLNIFPKPNYAFQLAYGNLVIICLIFLFIFAITPLSVGFTLSSFGWIGFILQLMVCVVFWGDFVLDEANKIKSTLYQDELSTDKKNNLYKKITNFINKYGGILLFISILNRWTFNIGEVFKENPGLLSFLFGWAFILVAALFFATLSTILKDFVAAFYFFRYRKEYRKYFKIPNEQWYGKWIGKFKNKKGE